MLNDALVLKVNLTIPLENADINLDILQHIKALLSRIKLGITQLPVVILV